MRSPPPAQAAEVAIRVTCARIVARWTPEIDAAGDDLVVLRRVFREMAADVGERLAEMLVTAGTGSSTPADITSAVDRLAPIVAAVIVDLGEMIGREAGAPFASPEWLADVGGQAAEACRRCASELRNVPEGRA